MNDSFSLQQVGMAGWNYDYWIDLSFLDKNNSLIIIFGASQLIICQYGFGAFNYCSKWIEIIESTLGISVSFVSERSVNYIISFLNFYVLKVLYHTLYSLLQTSFVTTMLVVNINISYTFYSIY